MSMHGSTRFYHMMVWIYKYGSGGSALKAMKDPKHPTPGLEAIFSLHKGKYKYLLYGP